MQALTDKFSVLIPVEARSLNKRAAHPMAHARHVTKVREATAWMLAGKPKPALPCVVTVCRIANSTGLDEHDNLPGSLKACIDQVAHWLGLKDDRDPRVTWVYAQERGKAFAVRVTVEAA